MDGSILVPNQSPWPSTLTNTPEFASLLVGTDLSTIAETIAIEAPNRSMVITPQGPVTDMMSMRQRYPFLEIEPLPTGAVALLLATIGAAYEMPIPDGAVYARLTSSSPVFMTQQGNAEVPVAGNAAQGPSQARSVLIINTIRFYVGGVRALSFASPTANAYVSGSFYNPDQWPR